MILDRCLLQVLLTSHLALTKVPEPATEVTVKQ